jgi:Ca2+-binding RTX toxin-like protein
MTLTATEQYLLELMNRARLDPAAEAARMGIDLNLGLAAGTISETAKQVLAPNALLEAAATGHSLWELAADLVSHTGAAGSAPKARMEAAGYTPNQYGENLALIGTTPGQSQQSALEAMNRSLFENATSRQFLLNAGYRELGVGAESGTYTQAGHNYAAVALTLNFGTSGPGRFLTGVAYSDSNKDAFYSIGEGTANVLFTNADQTVATAAAGGYSLALGSAAATAVTGSVGTLNFALTVDMSGGNVKLDVVSGTTFATSGNLVLGAGINNVLQLGVADLNATGNASGNCLTGNSGDNALTGLQGNDKLYGNAGIDVLIGGYGNDRLTGGKDGDMLTGGVGADVFVFGAHDGVDQITDFNIADGDRLQLDDALWGNAHLRVGGIINQFLTKGTGELLLDFGSGEHVHLLGLTGIGGLAGAIDIV